MEKLNIQKNCPACNGKFDCKKNDIENCFCNSLTINSTNLKGIKSKYTDCLCLNCLKTIETKEVNSSSYILYLFIFLFYSQSAFSQFPGPVGYINTTAMHKDSSAFVGWASGCVVTRGLQNISTPSLGVTDVGTDLNGTLKAGDNSVVSLGDGGSAILTFPSTIKNGTGFDFAVFENAFNDLFLELAFVEVSSDGINFFRFPATSNTQYTTQIGPFDEVGDATKLNNLAGKYRVNYGTPFDLEELKNTPGLDVTAISHIKVTDVVGAISAPHATYDQNNKPVNDPFPTAFGNGGFDLDAVGVIHQNPVGLWENASNLQVTIFPNPCHDWIKILNPDFENVSYTLTDMRGTMIKTVNAESKSTTMDVHELQTGIYLLTLRQQNSCVVKKISVLR